MGEANRRGSFSQRLDMAPRRDPVVDQEERDLIRQLRPRGSPTFHRGFPHTRNRRVARGDRRTGPDGKWIGPDWKQQAVFVDDDAKVIDVPATRFAIAKAYLSRRRLSPGRASSFKKLSKAARLLNHADVFA